jgi:DNA-binding transcriptional regulator YhcF (GntR family)
MDEPPSTRIAGTLRERIRSGELAPGDRVPSTRDITRQWGVAMATATKVLSALRDEGLVRAVPGVGTVVAGRETTSVPRRPAPSHTDDPAPALDRIVRRGIAIADAEGLAAVSMRRVGVELGTATMSLYRHVADKEDLVTRMIDAAFGEVGALPDPPPSGWRAAVESAAHDLWATFRRHPWLAAALSFTRPQPTAAGMAYSDRVLTALEELRLDPVTAFSAHLIVFDHVRGAATSLEPEREAEADTGLSDDEWMDVQAPELRATMAARDLPVLTRTMDALMAHGYDHDLDALFATGLTWLLDGLERRLAA